MRSSSATVVAQLRIVIDLYAGVPTPRGRGNIHAASMTEPLRMGSLTGQVGPLCSMPQPRSNGLRSS
jgi:hypothetical protein